MTTKVRAALAVLTIAGLSGFALGSDVYQFVFDSTQSGMDADVNLALKSAGTLIGNYDIDTNPTGTRTKPGAFGPFGDTENVAIETTLDFAIGGHLASATAGAFVMDIDQEANALVLNEYSANFLGSGPLSLPAEITLETETFRTRNPSSLYIGDIPITLPLGDVTLSQLHAAQIEPNAPGLLTPLGGGKYAFLVAPTVELSGMVSVLEQELELPPTPVLLPFAGELTVSGATALITSLQPLDLEQTLNPDQALPEIPLDLPTILPPGEIAHVLLNLVLTEISASVSGSLNTRADGVLVPEPASLLLLAASGALLADRARRATPIAAPSRVVSRRDPPATRKIGA